VLVPANALSGLPVIGGNLGGPFPRVRIQTDRHEAQWV
jgi:hypothetical protein